MENENSKKGDITNYIEENFNCNPNLKFRGIITKRNYSNGFYDIFEIYKSNNELYLASPNKDDYILDIITIRNCKLFISLKCHNNFIIIVKYFKNLKNDKEYLISVDKYNIIIIWDINNHYSCHYKIESQNSKGFISGVIIIFNILDSYNKENTLSFKIQGYASTSVVSVESSNNDLMYPSKICTFSLESNFSFCDKDSMILNANEVLDEKFKNNYIIFSFNCKEYTNIYSLDKRYKIKNIENTNKYNTYYLIFWYNKKDKNNYIIELSDGNIYIYNIKDNSLYCNLKLGVFDYSKNNCGFIYNNNNSNNDFLIVSSSCGNIMIWDLINKNMYYNIPLYKHIDQSKLYISYILQWSKKYIIVCEYFFKGFIIIDIENFKIIASIKGENIGLILCAKKFYHPIYRESLLSSDQDNNVFLWSI